MLVHPHAMFNPHFMWDKQIEAKNKVLCGKEKIFFIRLGEENGNPFLFLPRESHGQRSLAGHGP